MSLTERPVHSDLKTMLVNNEPCQYAHLVKFERPSKPDAITGLVSTAKQRYTYITDASIDVSFDDGSTDLQGNANGTQVYLANKLLRVGTITEQTKAVASSTSIVVDGNALGATITSNVNIASAGTDLWDITFLAPVTSEDVMYAGFREGDKVTINGTAVNIKAFRSGNVIRVSKIDTNLVAVTNQSVTLKISSEEIISILLNKNSSDYASFINREVYIHRAYFRNGVVVGTPILIFKGIIHNVTFQDSDSDITVTWGLNSHWGDFAQVKGRITSDSFHRALNENGAPQPVSTIKPLYAYDKGFQHAETSIHLLSTYTVMIEKMDVKAKSGFFGIGAKVKVKKYFVPEDRHVNLDFELNAKSIPVVYGVRMLDGIGVFADTLASDSSTVYIVTALCEGEIGGIYDIIIEGNSLICNDQADFDARSTQTSDNTIPLVCRGRADRGDALGGQIITSGTPYFYYNSSGEQASLAYNYTYAANYYMSPYDYGLYNYSAPTQYNTYGVVDGETISLTSPQEIFIDFFSGKTGQKASAQLSNIAYNKQFKVQTSYWIGSNSGEYWGPNHRLLDTAYVVGKYKIKEGETTVPDIKYIVRGKVINCYNYDYSYIHDRKASSESEANFKLGDTVSLYRSDNNALINNGVQIIDKWTFRNPDGTQNTRFRFSATPSLGYDVNGVPSITKFYMKNGANQTWTMTTYNHNLVPSSLVPGPISSTISSVNVGGASIVVNFGSNSYMSVYNDSLEASPSFQVVDAQYGRLSKGDLFPDAILTGTATSTSLTIAGYTTAMYGPEASAILSNFPSALLVSKNTIRLPASANGTDSYYVGDIIEVTRHNTTTGKSIVQTAEITGYNGANKIATIGTIWDFIPTSTDYVRVFPKYADERVSINPAIQTLDYMTSKTYGRGLEITKDVDLPSFNETARKCDTQSNVTVAVASSTTGLVAGDIYKLLSDGEFQWQGTVNNIFTYGSTTFVEFVDCIGKMSNKWNSWKVWKKGNIVYNSNYNFYYIGGSGGTVTTEPSHLSGTIDPDGGATAITYTTNIAIQKVSGAGPANITMDLSNGNFVRSVRNGQKISGYSLYDSDDVSYWRLSGWDEHEQRYVTKNQSNLVIDTGAPLFDNTNSLLEHYNGILRYSSGKYYLDVEEAEGAIQTTDIRTITTDDIVGKIQLSDEGIRGAFNSLTAAFADPGNKFEARSVSFFNSDYLKIDRNVPKKGNLSIPGITNYYNCRLLADGFLNKSRYGLTINMTIRTHGILLLAGTVIQVIYPRYDWISPGKKFRIESITYHPDGLSDIVAKEYDDSFYSASSIRSTALSGPTGAVNTGLLSPTNLIVTSADTQDELLNGVELFWDNNPNVNPSNCYTEIYGGLSPTLYIDVISITSTTTFTTTAPHGLVPGMPIFPKIVSNGLDSEAIYYVLTTPTSTTFTLSSTKTGTTPATFTDGAGLEIKFRTATLLATVAVPIRSYVDNVVNEGTGRVEKYYWVRHKVNQV